VNSRNPAEPAFERAAQVAARRQGEVLALPDVCVVVADAAWPLDDLSAAAASEVGGAGLVAVPHPTDLVVLLTQTCDLQRTDADAYFCQVAPVITVDESFARQVMRGYRPGWVSLPWHDLNGVGDLSRITTLERSVIVEAGTRGVPRTPAERLSFAESVSRHLTRIALPDKVSNVIAPVLRRMRERHDRKTLEGQCIARVASLRLEATPDLDSESADLRLLLVLEGEDLPPLPEGTEMSDEVIDALMENGHEAAADAALAPADPVRCRAGWQALAELWLGPAITAAETADSGIGEVDIEVLNGYELSFARSRTAPELDLAYLTSRAA
jgi:hypothetical protein